MHRTLARYLVLGLVTACHSAGRTADPDGPPTEYDPVSNQHSSETPPRVAAERDWIDLLASGQEHWALTNFGGEGEVRFTDEGLHLDFGSPLTGVTWIGEALPTTDYEVEMLVSRELGTDFFAGLSFPVGEQWLTLVLGGWAGATVGLSCLDGQDASQNETTQYVRFEQGKAYAVRLRVHAQRVRVWLDGEPLIDVDTTGRRLELRTEVLASRPFGVACYNTESWIHELRLRPLGPAEHENP